MKHILAVFIFAVCFSFLGFGEETRVLTNDTITIHETSIKILQTQLDELFQLSSYGINIIKDNLINHGRFLPVIFSYSNNKNFKVISYEDPVINDTSFNDFAHERLLGISGQELKNDTVQVVSIVYRDKINSPKYPNGSQCISLLFISKGFGNSVLESFPVTIVDGKLVFEDVVVQILKK